VAGSKDPEWAKGGQNRNFNGWKDMESSKTGWRKSKKIV
jgi:hypothetical protein